MLDRERSRKALMNNFFFLFVLIFGEQNFYSNKSLSGMGERMGNIKKNALFDVVAAAHSPW